MQREAMLWERLEGGRVHCYLCAHHCRINEERFGFCGMRKNIGGALYTYAYGEVIANHIDPIEKKPLYHFLPDSFSYSIATVGCNFHCSFCQNWTISQISARDGDLEGYGALSKPLQSGIRRSSSIRLGSLAKADELKPEEIVREAVRANCRSISYTYTEPTIFFEYAYDTARVAKENGLYNVFVTNGFMTKEAIEEIKPYLDGANIDLKFFNDDLYKKICSGRLQPVLDSIRNMKELGIWVEVTTLLVPGENDAPDQLKALASFLASVNTGIPWHISRFHPDYKYMDNFPTPIETMEKALEIGKDAGLKYIYLGNVSSHNDTICPGCGTVLIERVGFNTKLLKDFETSGKCMKCNSSIEGVWWK